MVLHMIDEVIRIPGRGAALIVSDGDPGALADGGTIRDVHGRAYRVAHARQQDGLYMLYLPDADPDALERLFRDVRVDATAFEIEPGEGEAPCP